MQAWAFGQAGSEAVGTFASKARGFHSPGLHSPIRSDVFFPLCKSQSRKELFICQRLHQGKKVAPAGTEPSRAAPAPRAGSRSSLGIHQPSPTCGQSHRDSE